MRSAFCLVLLLVVACSGTQQPQTERQVRQALSVDRLSQVCARSLEQGGANLLGLVSFLRPAFRSSDESARDYAEKCLNSHIALVSQAENPRRNSVELRRIFNPILSDSDVPPNSKLVMRASIGSRIRFEET